jgi:poly-gamma-glutamate synthesis protein (capsule biosynthesis protein)
MLARGIDMIQKYSCDPVLYEGNNLNAHDYVEIAERQNGKIPNKALRAVDYVWGDAIQVLEEKRPDLRIINLETSVTTNDTPWPQKGIHYRMHPKNVDIIKSAKIDCCVLANNHTADWGYEGLKETLITLREVRIAYAGAGFNAAEAKAPAVFDLTDKGRVLVFAGGHQSSGVPDDWRARESKEGVNILDIHHTSKAVSDIKSQVKKYKKSGDIIVLSIHWGGNWGFELEPFMQKFAHAVINEAGVDVIHGHSSHHVKGVEIYKGRLIIYGCGDFLNDYEGIGGRDRYRGNLALMYFVDIDIKNGNLLGMTMVPTETKHLRVNLAGDADVKWLQETMSRECQKFGCNTKLSDKELHLVF